MAIPFTNVTGSVTVSGTEYSLPAAANYSSGSPQTTAIKLQLALDVSGMVAGDTIQVTIYDKANAGTQAPVFQCNLVGTQSRLFTLPERWVKEGWDVTIKLIAGAGSTVKWSLHEDVGDRSLGAGAITSSSFATDAIDANALATNAVAELAAGVLGATVEGSNTLVQILRLFAGVLAGKVSDFTGTTLVFKSLDGTKTRLTVVTDATGRTTITVGDLS